MKNGPDGSAGGGGRPVMNRRGFLKSLGGGIVVYFSSGELSAEEARKAAGGGAFGGYLQIKEDGRITVFTGKVEMGQGIITSLAQTAAEELDVPLDSVDMVMGDTDLCPYDAGTFGSLTTPAFSPLLKAAAAEAKAILMVAAARRLGLPEERLRAKDGFIADRRNRAVRISYGELARELAAGKTVRGNPSPKKPADFRVVGRAAAATDAIPKTTGEAKFAGDIRLPGMLYARILRPPAHGARLKRVDTSAAEKMPGVRVVRTEGLIAALAPHPETAEKALLAVKAEFEIPPAKLDERTIHDHLLKVAPEGGTVAGGGDLGEGKKLAAKVFEETYLDGYVAHAPLETHTALAFVEKDRATVWASTQRPFAVKEDVARSAGLSSDRVRVITPFVGGGFGGKSPNLQSAEAAVLSKITGKPVQVAWTREEEFFLDVFRPAAVVKIRSGINAAGRIVFWDYRVYFAGTRSAAQFYDIPHHRTTGHGGWWGAPGAHPFPTGTWRAPASNTNAFAREGHMDVMAAGADLDPLEFRLKNLKDRRMKRVLEAAAEKFGWKPAPAPSRRGVGVACGDYQGTYVAMMAEVETNEASGEIRVKRVVCAQDMGLVINPEGATMQVEGCVMMGLGYTLSEEIRFNGGEILDLNFGTYEIPRFSRMPKIQTVLIDDPGSPPKGGGEPAIMLVGAAVANAVFDAAGARMFRLPMTPERVKEALKRRKA